MAPQGKSAQGDLDTLIGRLKDGESSAFDEFVERFGQRLLRFGERMCGNVEDAREVLQDTLLKTYESIGNLKHPNAFRTWLYRIASNACLMRRRKSRYLHEEVPLEEALPPAAPEESAHLPWEALPERVLLNKELRGALEDAISDLPSSSRLVLLLRDVEGLTTEETARALDLNRDVVKMRLYRARGRVRNALETYMSRSGAASPP